MRQIGRGRRPIGGLQTPCRIGLATSYTTGLGQRPALAVLATSRVPITRALLADLSSTAKGRVWEVRP